MSHRELAVPVRAPGDGEYGEKRTGKFVGKRKRIIVGSIAMIAALFAAALFASPYWTVYAMRKAVREHDAARLSEHVDFPALRGDLKSKLTSRVMQEAGREGRGSAMTGLASVLLLGMVDRVVDAMVSPAGVQMLLERGEVDIESGLKNSGGDAGVTHAPREARQFGLSYDSWGQVRIRPEDDGSTAFILRRHGLFDWKLSAVEFRMDGQ